MRVDDRGWVEFDTSAVNGDVPALPVALVVVGGAQQAAVSDRCNAAVNPVLGVVGFAQPGWSVAAGEGAAAVPGDYRPADAYRHATPPQNPTRENTIE